MTTLWLCCGFRPVLWQSFQKAQSRAVQSTAFDVKQAFGAGSKDRTIIIWDVENGIPAVVLKGHTEQVTALGMLSDWTLVSAAVDGCGFHLI